MNFRIFQCPLFISATTLIFLFSCNDDKVVPNPPTQPLLAKFTIATSSSVGGTITDSQNVDSGLPVKITATVQEHYQLKEWTGNCGTFNKNNSEIAFNATKNCQIGAEFEKINYDITATSSDGGSVSETKLSRKQGEIASFTAEPDEGYQFNKWTTTNCSDLQNLQNKVTFTVSGHCSLQAVFTKAPHTINIEKNENGEITITPSQTVNHGDEVEITATANQHYVFKGWNGTCGDFSDDESTIAITVQTDCTIEAVFEKTNYNISASSTDGGNVSNETLSIEYGQKATLKAIPNKGYQFSRWTITKDTGCPILTNEDTSHTELTFNVQGDCHVEAVFNNEPLTITIKENENGKITITPSQNVNHGDEVEIKATANQHFVFKGWNGTCGNFSTDEPTIAITALADCTIEAIFEKINYTITATSSDGGSVNKDTLSIEYGQTAALTAIPDEGYRFSRWTSEDCNTIENDAEIETEFIVEGNCSIKAVFEKELFNITASPSKGGNVNNETLSIEYGQKATLKATPDEGYVFDRWETKGKNNCPTLTDDASNPELDFTVLGDCQLQAVFVKTPIRISTSSSQGGNITETLKVNEGEKISIKASANDHFELKDWEGNCGEFNTENETISFIATKDCDIKAVFTKVLYSLTVDAGSGGSVETSKKKIEFGEKVEITAEVNDGYEFKKWSVSGSGCPDNLDSTYSIASFKVKGDCTLKAEFSPIIVETNHNLPTEEQKPTTDHNLPTEEQRSIADVLAIEIPSTTASTHCPTPLYIDTTNMVTVKANPCARSLIGQRVQFNNSEYIIADDEKVRTLVANGENVEKVNTTFVTNMYGLFLYNKQFNQNISSWDVSNVTNMFETFRGATSFNQDISKWDVGNVKSMYGMFLTAASFNQNLNSWDVSNVTNMTWIFRGAINFNGNIASWDVSNVTDMMGAFYNARSFNQNIGSWDVGSVTDMKYMFIDAKSFNQNLNSWNVSNVTTMRAMFHRATRFNGNISSWIVSNVTDMHRMFENAKSFNQGINSWSTNKVTDCEKIYLGADSLEESNRASFSNCNTM